MMGLLHCIKWYQLALFNLWDALVVHGLFPIARQKLGKILVSWKLRKEQKDEIFGDYKRRAATRG